MKIQPSGANVQAVTRALSDERLHLARDPGTDRGLLSTLAHDGDESVRHAAINNPATPLAAIARHLLAGGLDPQAAEQRLSVQEFQELYESPGTMSQVREVVLRAWARRDANAPLSRYAQHPDPLLSAPARKVGMEVLTD